MKQLRNCLSYWFPKVKASGVPVPETRIIAAPRDGLYALLDGKQPKGWEKFLDALRGGIEEIGGVPCFLRSGMTSAKHQWKDTCYLTDVDLLGRHVAEIVEFSECCWISLPTDIWAVRKLIPTVKLFEAFHGFPVTREFRVFVDDGKVQCAHPYWPPGSIEGNTKAVGWERDLEIASVLILPCRDHDNICALAMKAGKTLPGAWSIDVLQDVDGKWWVTDCADAGSSFHWPGCENEKRWERMEFAE